MTAAGLPPFVGQGSEGSFFDVEKIKKKCVGCVNSDFLDDQF